MRKVYEILETADGGFVVDRFLYQEPENLPALCIDLSENMFGLLETREDAVYEIAIDMLTDLERQHGVYIYGKLNLDVRKPKHE